MLPLAKDGWRRFCVLQYWDKEKGAMMKEPAGPPVIASLIGVEHAQQDYQIRFGLEGGGVLYLPISNAHLRELTLQFVRLHEELVRSDD
jgi:hypothetical protein